jgi:hypothetical protein
VGEVVELDQELKSTRTFGRYSPLGANRMDIPTVLLSTLKMHTEHYFKTSVTNKTNSSNNLNDHNLNISSNLT